MKLKKFFKYTTFLSSIFIFMILCVSNVSAATESFYSKAIRDSSGNVRFLYSNFGKSNAYFVKIMKQSNNNPAYCIEPSKELLDFSEGSYNYTSDENSVVSMSSLTIEKIRKLKLISYYGYGYGSHTDDSWYVATQMEIWETVSPGCCTISKGDATLINNQRKEIRDLVNGVILLPTFQNKTYTQVINESVEYIDSNNVISNYSITNCTNCSAKIKGNKLVVESNKVGTSKVNLSRSVTNVYSPSVLYYSGAYQKVMELGSPDPMNTSVTFNIIGGTIKIQKIDKETGKNIIQGDATLKGAEYSVYDENNKLVGTIVTNENGYGELLVGLGNFTVIETKAPEGYLLSDKKYTINLTTDCTEETIIAEEQVIKGHALLTKLYGDDEIGFIKEENAEFEVINSKNEVVGSIKTDQDGVGLVELPYGDYIIHQIKGKENFKISDDIKISIKENNKIYKFTIKNLSLPRFEITKKDISNSEVLEGATIEIYKQNELTKEYEIYYNGTTDKTGKIYIDKIDLGKYYFIEKEAPEGYIINEEKHYFEINEYGKTYKRDITNQKYSSVEITKKDISNSEVLEGATIEIYKQNKETEEYELYYTGITNSTGKIYLDKIELGKYYFIEKEAPEGYIINDQKHYFEISENGILHKFELSNEKIIKDVPDTFSKRSYNLYIISTSVILMGISILLYGKQKGDK